MRIIQGRLKGLLLPRITGDHRPFTAKAREWLFQYLQNIEHYSFLDLFAGTGIMSLEAFSCGALPTAVERDKKTVVQVRTFLKKHDIYFPYLAKPAESFIKQQRGSFDIVFLDPPFSYAYKSNLLLRLYASPIVALSTTVIMHVPKKERLTLPKGVQIKKEKLFGYSCVYVFISAHTELS